MAAVSAQLNNLRISPRKVRAVADLIKGLDADMARAQLQYITRRPARHFLKLLDSALSNAQHNSGLDKNYLYIKEIIVNEGMKLKRYKPKGFSLTMPIQKKTSHIKIVLAELSEEKRKKKAELIARMPKVEERKEEKGKEKKEIKAEQKPKTEKPSLKVSKKG